MELEEIKLATKKYCLYKLATSGKIYDINVKELDQVFCVGYHALSFEREYLKFIEWMKEENHLGSFRVSTHVKGVTTGFYSQFIHNLFRVKALDVACELIERRGNEG